MNQLVLKSEFRMGKMARKKVEDMQMSSKLSMLQRKTIDMLYDRFIVRNGVGEDIVKKKYFDDPPRYKDERKKLIIYYLLTMNNNRILSNGLPQSVAIMCPAFQRLLYCAYEEKKEKKV